MSNEGERFRVLIPTTAGVVEVLLLTEEDPVIARSVACIGGTTQTADIDAAYHAFVTRPTGVVERLFGHPCYRLDVSGRIDAGSSWQLGVLAAHALHAAGRLAQEGQEADAVLWATGTVRAVDLTVGAVSHVPEKLAASRERLQREAEPGARVLLAVPAANASDLASGGAAALATHGATLLDVATVRDLWDKLALPEPGAPRHAGDPARENRPQSTGLNGQGAQAFVPGSRLPRSVPLMAPDPPRGFVERADEMALLKARLLDSRGGIVALRGAGGFGKTSLANHLCRDPDVRSAYGAGILHVELGERPDNLVTRIADIVEVLTGERSGLQTVGALSAALAAALGEARYLLVIDDAWREQDLHPFLQGGPNTTRLVTTRLEHVLPADAFRVSVDAMQGGEAVALLARGLPAEQWEPARPALLALAAKLGEWPLQLTLVNGFLRDRVNGGRRPLAQAIADVERRLEARGLTAFDAKNDAARHHAVDKTLGVSLELLTRDEQARFRELGVFPEDTDVPLGICARLWRETGALDEIDSEDLLQKLSGCSLLLGLDLEQRTFRLHDVVRQYLLDGWKREPAADAVARLHGRLIAAMADLREVTFDAEGERRYACAHGAAHLAAAGQREELSALLLDPRWMLDKLKLAGPQSLISDYRAFAAGRAQELIGGVLDLSGRILAKDPGQLPAQMLARLAPEDAEGLPAFLTATSARLPRAALVPSRPTFTAPGAEVRRFEGHTASVEGLAVVDPRRFVSCSRDGTLRLWDASAGSELRRFEGHEGPVFWVASLDRRRVLSASADRTIRLWDVETGQELRRLVGHEGGVTCLALSDGLLISGSEDRTLRLWDVETGRELRRIELPEIEAADASTCWRQQLLGHTEGVTSLAIVGGRAVCGLADRSLRLVDLSTGKELRRFGDCGKHARPVCSLAALDGDRFLAGGSDDGILRLWEAQTGRELRCLEGVRFWATAMATLDGNRVAVGTSGYAEVDVLGRRDGTADCSVRRASVCRHQRRGPGWPAHPCRRTGRRHSALGLGGQGEARALQGPGALGGGFCRAGRSPHPLGDVARGAHGLGRGHGRGGPPLQGRTRMLRRRHCSAGQPPCPVGGSPGQDDPPVGPGDGRGAAAARGARGTDHGVGRDRQHPPCVVLSGQDPAALAPGSGGGAAPLRGPRGAGVLRCSRRRRARAVRVEGPLTEALGYRDRRRAAPLLRARRGGLCRRDGRRPACPLRFRRQDPAAVGHRHRAGAVPLRGARARSDVSRCAGWPARRLRLVRQYAQAVGPGDRNRAGALRRRCRVHVAPRHARRAHPAGARWAGAAALARHQAPAAIGLRAHPRR